MMWAFSHWDINGEIFTTPEVTIPMDGPKNAKAYYVPEGTIVTIKLKNGGIAEETVKVYSVTEYTLAPGEEKEIPFDPVNDVLEIS